jgi:DNA-binding transcriptional ArsR family regulator
MDADTSPNRTRRSMDTLQIIIEPKRRSILRMVWDREESAGAIASAFDVTFGAISQHLGVLREAGLVTVRTDGNRRLYRANRDVLEPYRDMLETMWASALDELARAVEADET